MNTEDMHPEYTGHPDNYPQWKEAHDARMRARERRRAAALGEDTAPVPEQHAEIARTISQIYAYASKRHGDYLSSYSQLFFEAAKEPGTGRRPMDAQGYARLTRSAQATHTWHMIFTSAGTGTVLDTDEKVVAVMRQIAVRRDKIAADRQGENPYIYRDPMFVMQRAEMWEADDEFLRDTDAIATYMAGHGIEPDLS